MTDGKKGDKMLEPLTSRFKITPKATTAPKKGDTLLEPFRPRNTMRSMDGLRSSVHNRVNDFTRTCSRTSRSIARITRSSRDLNSAKSTSSQPIEPREIFDASQPGIAREVTEYRQNVVSFVHDDELFRKLQMDMRKSALSGCGSRHVIHKLVEEHQNEMKRERQLNIQSCHSRVSSVSMRNIRPISEVKDMRVNQGYPEEPRNRREYFMDLKSKSVPGRQLVSGFTSSFRAGIQSRLQTPPCA